jgi:hypothetical protein
MMHLRRPSQANGEFGMIAGKQSKYAWAMIRGDPSYFRSVRAELGKRAIIRELVGGKACRWLWSSHHRRAV